MLGREDMRQVRIAVTGRKFKDLLTLSTITEPEALELACAHILPSNHPYRVVISAGGESTMVYHLDDDGRVQNIHTGNKCASGTGEFFLQQLGRMSISLDEVAAMELPESMHKVSGRCSVFCKSDCTHALNKGVPKDQVVAGLSFMMAGKILELLRRLPKESVMLIGGCARNHAMVHYLRDAIKDLFIPAEADFFEALGAACWALDNRNQVVPFSGLATIFREKHTHFSFHKPLSEFRNMVEFKEQMHGLASPGDSTILGLDVGSTTTKGVIMRRRDKMILAADYLRTNGDPVGASRRVYRSLAGQIQVPINIEGLGVTGSGRQIAGLHAMTDGVINEIIAHATAAVFFDPKVDTIFEIGGQDAKYTYITNSVPSDYAMNEACSAGTGSFLEEAAKESLGLDVTEIGTTALAAEKPPNFNDQCAAFISSDIKGAAHENVPLDDIVGGLVYSICMNYTNRVKGNRPVGNKVFMQGGVCYNQAIPIAMAALTGKQIVVPPDPGLMGAFGVALEVERRQERGLLKPGRFDLVELMDREVSYGKPFRCGGGKECDRKCEIARIKINGRLYPFGGICNRFDNIVQRRKIDSRGLNLADKREQRLFRDLAPDDPADLRPTVGLNRSFLNNTYFPFFNTFFTKLGFRVVLPSVIDPVGVDQQGAPFCYPGEMAHGYAGSLLTLDPDFIFLPHLKGIPGNSANSTSCTCVFVQGEPFYLRTAFPGLNKKQVLSPMLDFSMGIEANLASFKETARWLGVDQRLVKTALAAGIAEQEAFFADIRQMGDEALAALEDSPERFGVALFGRSYNSFASAANKGIPAKFASRGIMVIPIDMLPLHDQEIEKDHNMYWATGSMNLKGSYLVRKHPRLFATYITNFSCGPDSFIISFFRDIMGSKPSLTLELDSHTADAGLETRIEAFLDVIQYFRQLPEKSQPGRKKIKNFKPAVLEQNGSRVGVRTSSDRWLPLTDEQVKVVLPAMGRYGTPLLARSFARIGIRAEPLPPADEEMLKLGRGNSSCKECLPLQTTIGSLLHYLAGREPDEITAYFMASAEGPCRFGQYNVFSKRVIEKHEIPDAAVLSPSPTNGYGELGDRFMIAAWRALIIGDLFDEMWSTVLAGAVHREQALAVLEQEFQALLGVIDKNWSTINAQLAKSAVSLARISLKIPYEEIPKISLIGEIYVRHDPISLQRLIERMADRGFIVRTAHNSEWFKYVDWLTKNRIEGKRNLGFWTRLLIKRFFDRRIRKRLAPAGLFHYEEDASIEPFIEAGKKFISPNFTCESILTVGAALHEILHPACGIISIGPFGCMPSRVAEAILNEKFSTTTKRELVQNNGQAVWPGILSRDRKLPFVAIETDGNAFPQIIEARLEAFCLQARWLNNMMLADQSE
jgi:predicted CoA-substrate-specific enzyme activase